MNLKDDDGRTDVLYLRPDGSWGEISWSDWVEFREEKRPLPELSPGDQLIVIVVYSQDEKDGKTYTYNVIPHALKVDVDSTFSHYPSVLTPEESAEVNRLMLSHDADDARRYDELMEKDIMIARLSTDQMIALMSRFRHPIHPTDGGIHRSLKESKVDTIGETTKH